MESTFILVKVITILWSLMKQYLQDSLETLTKQEVQQVGGLLSENGDVNISILEQWRNIKYYMKVF